MSREADMLANVLTIGFVKMTSSEEGDMLPIFSEKLFGFGETRLKKFRLLSAWAQNRGKFCLFSHWNFWAHSTYHILCYTKEILSNLAPQTLWSLELCNVDEKRGKFCPFSGQALGHIQLITFVLHRKMLSNFALSGHST